MMLLWTAILSLLIVHVVAPRCPAGYTLYSNGDCMKLVGLNMQGRIDVMTELALDECQKDGAYPPIIHTKETDSRLFDVYRGGMGAWITILGLVCDSIRNKFRWADGSALDYVNTIKADQPCNGNWIYSRSTDRSWVVRTPAGSETWNWTIICTKPFNSHMDADCFDFDRFTAREGNNTSCFQISSTSSDWSSAQSACQANFASLSSVHSNEENDFVRNLSISKGYHTGVHIGALVSGKGSNKFGWIDGTEMDYDNYYDGFPLEGFGDCTAMDLSSGLWMNDECATNLPFVCKRDPDTITPACGSHLYKPGEIITPPGYPKSASEPCDYFLKVDAGKIVELEILLLEANACCDHFLIYDGQFENEPFANLTGSDRSGEIFRTSSTVNIMRVSWQPKGTVNVRGFVMTFRAV